MGESAGRDPRPDEDDLDDAVGWDDVIAEYAHMYGGPPAPDLPWQLFLALSKRASRFDARRLLGVMDGTAYGASRVLSGGHELDQMRSDVEKAAYPTRSGPPKLALKQSKD